MKNYGYDLRYKRGPNSGWKARGIKFEDSLYELKRPTNRDEPYSSEDADDWDVFEST